MSTDPNCSSCGGLTSGQEVPKKVGQTVTGKLAANTPSTLASQKRLPDVVPSGNLAAHQQRSQTASSIAKETPKTSGTLSSCPEIPVEEVSDAREASSGTCSLTSGVNPSVKRQAHQVCSKPVCGGWIKDLTDSHYGNLMVEKGGCLFKLDAQGKNGFVTTREDGFIEVTCSPCVDLDFFNQFILDPSGVFQETPPELFPYLVIQTEDGCLKKLKGFEGRPSYLHWDGSSFTFADPSTDEISTSQPIETVSEIILTGLTGGCDEFSGFSTDGDCGCECGDIIGGKFNEDAEEKAIKVFRPGKSGLLYYDEATCKTKVAPLPKGYNPDSANCGECEEEVFAWRQEGASGCSSQTIKLPCKALVQITADISQNPSSEYTSEVATYQIGVGSSVLFDLPLSLTQASGSATGYIELESGDHTISINNILNTGCAPDSPKVRLSTFAHCLNC